MSKWTLVSKWTFLTNSAGEILCPPITVEHIKHYDACGFPILPPVPVQEVSAITYVGPAGDLQTLKTTPPPCPECNGTGEYIGLTTVEACRCCGGKR